MKSASWFLVSTVLVFVLVVASPGRVRAEAMDVPLEVQIPLLLKVLTYDNNLSERMPSDSLILAIVYSSQHPESRRVKEDVMATVAHLALTEIGGKPISWTFIDVDRPGVLDKIIKLEHHAAWYVAPGIDARIADISAASRQGQVATLSGVVSFVEHGISVAVTSENGKPRIVVNLPSSKEEGCDFSSDLLKLSRVIR